MTWINLQIYTKGVAGVFKGEGGVCYTESNRE